MKKWILIIALLAFWACQKPIHKSPRPEPVDAEEMIPLEDLLTPVEAIVPHPNRACGELEVDPDTGERAQMPRMDLIVSEVEVLETSHGVRVIPTIKNICDEPVNELFGVLIQSNNLDHTGTVVFMENIPAHTEVRLGYAVGIPSGSVYTITVDWDRRVDEANEDNNRCVLRESGRCRQ